MKNRTALLVAQGLIVGTLLAACGGGGGSTPEAKPGTPLDHGDEGGPNRFLLFPNPLVQADGSEQTNTVAYAEAYYRAIDPTNAKDTLDKWKAANGFGTPAGPLGEATAIFGDVRDLGYGRAMSGRQNPDGSIAMTVGNYQVAAGDAYGYSRLNLDAAVAGDDRWHVGTNAIEYSPGPNGGPPFTKFYTFEPKTGARLLEANLDGRGKKAMPGICINCHGGRGDPLTPPDASGKPLFNRVANSTSRQRGDTVARMQMFDVASFDFSTVPGYTRADQEAALKKLNRLVLCTWPLAGPSTHVEDACRPAADPNDWQGTAAASLKAAYGGDGLPSASFIDTYVPDDWKNAGQSTLYREVVHPFCITCHQMRGTGNMSDVNFASYAKFRSYADRIKAHVFERGNMPLAEIVYDAFWDKGGGTLLGTWLEAQGHAVRNAAGAIVPPGRPVAVPGPDRAVPPGATLLSARGSLYADAYKWSLVTNPGGATLSGDTTATPTLAANVAGTYVVQLVASAGTAQSAPALQTIVVANGVPPTAVRFADVKNVLQTAGCTSCHADGVETNRPPVLYTDLDRNGDGFIDGVDDLWLHAEVRARANFIDIAGSPLLRKPSGNHHNGGLIVGFNAASPPGSADRASYDLFLNWILAGAPF